MEFGNVLLLLSVLFSALSVFGFVKRWKLGFYALVGYTLSITLALLLLLHYFLIHDYNVIYVYEYSDNTLPLVYLVSAIWAGKEGSLLLWIFFLAVFNVIFYLRSKDDIALAVSSSVFLFLSIMLLLISNPFERWAYHPTNGFGLNPLLRTPEMVLHPPVVFLAYSSMTIPFAITISSVIRGESWIGKVRKPLLITWLFLTLGIFLGMLWSYKVLGWGGFWGWDPVENASLLPWLTVTALLHGIMVEERRKALGNLNYWLCVLSFDLVILATFITRSGIINSVHAFAKNPVGMAYLVLIIGATVFSAIVWMIERDRFPKGSIPTSSVDFLLFVNVLLLLIITLTVLLGTLAGISVSVSRAYYQTVVLPLIAITIVLSGMCTGGDTVKGLGVGAIAFIIVLLLFKAPLLATVVGICAFAFVNHVPSISTKGRRLGGYLAHFGVMCLLIGAIGAWYYSVNYSLTLMEVGQSARLGNVYVKLLDAKMFDLPDRIEVIAKLLLKIGNESYVLAPKDIVYKIVRADRLVSVVDIVSTPFRDIYVAMPSCIHGFYFEIHIIPLISFVWISMLLFTVGGLYAILRR